MDFYLENSFCDTSIISNSNFFFEKTTRCASYFQILHMNWKTWSVSWWISAVSVLPMTDQVCITVLVLRHELRARTCSPSVLDQSNCLTCTSHIYSIANLSQTRTILSSLNRRCLWKMWYSTISMKPSFASGSSAS